MAEATAAPSSSAQRPAVAFGIVLLAAGGVFAVTMGARQSMGLFLSVINTTTGLVVVLVFAVFIGLAYLSTVPATAGLVAKFFGTSRMATLFCFVMLSHQPGGLPGAWLGGKAFE